MWRGSPEQFLEYYRRCFRDEAGNAVDAVPAEFSDATYYGTLASALGIVQGKGNGPFGPGRTHHPAKGGYHGGVHLPGLFRPDGFAGIQQQAGLWGRVPVSMLGSGVHRLDAIPGRHGGEQIRQFPISCPEAI